MIENSYNLPKTQFWKNKKVLITGHNGFKGSWLTLWLLSLGAIISGFSKENDNELDLFKELEISKDIENNILDISNKEKLFKIIKSFKPDIIFHLAAQPLVRRSYKEPSFPINGKDLINNGLKPGKEVGLSLEYLKSLWIESDFSLNKLKLIDLLNNKK